MKLHSDVITRDMIYAAAQYAGTKGYGRIYVDVMGAGSRARRGAYNVTLTSDGTVTKRRTNPGNSNGSRENYAATWEAWGHFLGYLYSRDENLLCGTSGRPFYTSRKHFIEDTEEQGCRRGAREMGEDFIPSA